MYRIIRWHGEALLLLTYYAGPELFYIVDLVYVTYFINKGEDFMISFIISSSTKSTK
jgi:hypothetical protein